ncbi:MAG TPA: hypothetical protein VNZ86_05005, partial [Bacteroidia bacterium]|nr:hypothetical protein [Bacteroidia bacterium]
FGEQKVVLQFQNKISSGAKPLLHDDASLALTRIQGYTARKYQFTVNTDSSRLSIQYTLKSVAKDVDKAPDVLSIHTFDEHLVSIHRDQYTMPYNRERMEIADYRLDTANKPCFLARVFDNPKPVTGSEGKYHLEAFHFQPGDAVPKIILVGAEGMNTQSLRLFQDKQGRMFCAGTYSHTEGTGEEGFCMLKLDLENNTALPYGQGIYPFPAEQKSVSDKAHVPAKPRANQAEPVKLPLSLLGLCFHPNGTITVAGEEQGITQTEIPGKKGKTETQNTYHYGTIVLMQLDPGGNMKWLKRIPKLQNGKEEEGEMSCAVGMSGNETVVVYVDDPKNLKLRSNQPPAAFADGSSASLLYMYIDALGKETRGALFDAKLKKLLVYPARFRQLSPVRMAGEAIGPEAETSFYVGINE